MSDQPANQPGPASVNPFIYVELRSDTASPNRFEIDVQSGGGIDNPAEVAALLQLAAESITNPTRTSR